MKLMLVAGEASGDAHGRELLKELNILIPELETFGIGGKGMLEMGLRPYFMLDTMQSHGITELLFHLPRLYRTLRLMQEALEYEKPDALVLIDYPGFNLKLAAQAKKLGIPVIFFSSPQIWVWRSGRIKKIKCMVDLMLVLFPFEERIYQKAGVKVRWVGHPLLDQEPSTEEIVKFREQYELDDEQTVLTLAPGSRPSEIQNHLPVFLQSLAIIKNEIQDLKVLMPVAETIEIGLIESMISSSPVKIRLVQNQFPVLVRVSQLAIVASGTASLQTGLALTPSIIIYRVSNMTYWIARKLAKVQHIGMVNILAENEIVPELLQQDFTPERLAEEAILLLKDQDRRATMVGHLKQIRSLLGEPGAYQRAAEILVDQIKPA